ncbi:MAG TPA: hypothetical protein VK764_05335 [Terracidiphilus sp.]|jgi:hypothetical protein|nr:hypothetical protein [Terracidiphilus sp.]
MVAWGGFDALKDAKKLEPSESSVNGRNALLRSKDGSAEILGLGVIAALIVAFWTLVADGTLPLAQYMVFVALLLVSAGGMVWRIWKLYPRESAAGARKLPPGAYRVSFGDSKASRS